MKLHIRDVVAVSLLVLAFMELPNVGSAFARGGGSNIMNSPGYQRALQESRQKHQDSYSQPYTQSPRVYPRKKWRHRGRR